MKQLFASLCISLALIVTPVAFDGCAGYNPPTQTQASTDQVILRAEQTAEAARLTMKTFVTFERGNEAMLKDITPQIHIYANTIRAHGLDWVDSLRSATKTFEANRTPQNQANVNTWVVTLTNAITQMNNYIAQAKKP